MPNNFIDDYLLHESGNEGSPQHHLWSAIALLSASAGRRYYLDYQDPNAYSQLSYNANILCCLVAPQGVRKTFCKDQAQLLFEDVFPEYPVCYNVETVAGICEFLGQQESERLYTDENNITRTWRPIFMPINELNNFLSINPQEMIDFIVDISDRKFYRRRTKNAGIFEVENPYLTILACATTEFIVDQLKGKILSGGLARRMLFINERNPPPRIPFPTIPPGGLDAKKRCKEHLVNITQSAGPITFENQAAKNWYDLWYRSVKLSDDSLLRGFDMSKHVHVLRLAMLWALAQYPLQKQITVEALKWATNTIQNIMPGMAKLFLAAGKNEYVTQQRAMIEFVERNEGMVQQKALMRYCEKDLDGVHYSAAERFLLDSGQLIRKDIEIEKGIIKRMVLTPEGLQKLENLNNGTSPT